VTIGEILVDTFPRLFEAQLSETGNIEIVKTRDFDVVVQGVEADLNTPLYWMQLNLSYLDNFLYISIHIN